MERDIVDIVKDKEFNQLSAAEREELQDFCSSEEEFRQLKSVFAAVDGMSSEKLTPRMETKEKLDALFHETYPGAAPVWYNSFFAVVIAREKPAYRQPLLQLAAVIAVILLAIPLFKGEMNSESNLLAEAEIAEVTNVNEDVSGPSEAVDDLQVDSGEETDELLSDNFVQANQGANFASAPMSIETPITRSITAEGLTSSLSLTVSSGDHPDGVFNANAETLSVAASETPDVLDLLTSTF